MPSAKAAHSVTGHKNRAAARRRYNRRTAEVEGATGNANLGQSYGLIDTAPDAEIGGVERCIRQSGAGEAIHAEAQFIDAPPEGVRLIEREELMQRYYVGSEAGNGGAPYPRLQVLRMVSAVVTVQMVALGEDVTNVHIPLIA